MIVASSGILIEIAILSTGSVVLTRNAAEIGIFGVVAGPRAIGVIGIEQLVPVVVEAISALIDLALTRGDLTRVHRRSSSSSVGPSDATGARTQPASASRNRSAGCSCAGSGQIPTHFDALRAVGAEQADAEAQRELQRSESRHWLSVSLP